MEKLMELNGKNNVYSNNMFTLSLIFNKYFSKYLKTTKKYKTNFR